MNLPTCRWRGDQYGDGKYPCRCPKFVHAPNNTTTAEICANQCPYVDCEAPEPVKPAPRVDTCCHIGEELRLENCPSCCGTVRLKVFGCAIHGECTISKKVGSIMCCTKPTTCADYRPKLVNE